MPDTPLAPSRARPTVASLARQLIGDLSVLTDRLAGLIRATDPAYDTLEPADIRHYVRENLRVTLRDLAAEQAPATDSARETARIRAQQGIPVAAVLHAFRLGFSVIWDAMVERVIAERREDLDELLRGASTLWAVVDAHSETVTAAYRDTLVEAARRDEQQRLLLLDALLAGHLGEWKALGGTPRALDLPDRGPYLAVSAETPGPGVEGLTGVAEFLRRHSVRSAWRLRADEQVGIVAVSHDRRASFVRDLLGTIATGRVGLSPPYDDATDSARALTVAAVARACLPPGATGTATIDDDPLAALLAGSPGMASRVATLLLGRVAQIGPDERRTLLTTLRTWIDAGGNSAEAGRVLFCHRNTVRNRLRRLEELSGRSLDQPRGAAELFVAAETLRLLPCGVADPPRSD